MSEEEKFDEIFRQKFAEKEFVFNEENWEKAEQKINAAKRSSKIVRWIAVFMIGLGCGIAVMLPFVGNKNENKTNEIAAYTDKTEKEDIELKNEKNKNIISQKEVKTENHDKEKVITNSNEKVIADVSDPKIKSENSHFQKTQSTSPKSDENQTSNSTYPKNKINSPDKSNQETTKVSSGNKNSEKEITPNATQAKKETRKTKFSGNPEPSEKKARENSSPKEKSTNVPEQMASNGVKDSDKNIPDNNSSQLNNSAQKETSSAQSKPSVQTSIQQTTGKDNLPDETIAQTTTATNLNQQSAVPVTKKDSVQSKSDLPAETPRQVGSSPVVSPNSPAEQPKMSGLSSTNIISIEAGTNFVLGWHYHDTLEGRGFNPLFGIGFTHYFNRTWSWYSALQYGSISNLNAQKIFASQNFSFGSNSVNTIVNTKTLYYAVLPIQFQYHFNDKNSIGIGGSVSYLVNSKSKVITNTISSDTLNMPGTQKTTTGYYSGAFNRWDASLCIAYRRRIYGKFSATASANYGLLDIKSNSFFSRNQFERNMGLKISISYDLFQF